MPITTKRVKAVFESQLRVDEDTLELLTTLIVKHKQNEITTKQLIEQLETLALSIRTGTLSLRAVIDSL